MGLCRWCHVECQYECQLWVVQPVKQLLNEALLDYEALRKSQDFSPRTLGNERNVMKRFLTINGNIWVHNITERHVIRHFEEASKTRSSASLQLDYTILGQFFVWARQTRRMAPMNDPMAGRRRPKTRRKERDRIPVSDFPRLLDLAARGEPRNRAVIAVLLYTLIRDNEARDLRIGDVSLDSGTIRVRISKTYTEDDMPICAELDAELRQWLSHYSASVSRPLRANDYLLPARKVVGHLYNGGDRGRFTGHELEYVPERDMGRIGRIMPEILERAGVSMTDHLGKPKMEGAHTIRRSGARALFDRLAAEGYDRALRIVQSMLHHSSIQTTELYIGVTADQRGRDELIRGQFMYGAPDNENVIQLSV